MLPTACKLRSLFHREQTDVARQMDGLGQDKPGAVIDDLYLDPAVDRLHRQQHARRVSVLFDVGQGFGDVLDQDGLNCRRHPVRQAKVDLCLDPGVQPNRFEALADRTVEVDVELEHLGAHVHQKPPQRVFNLAEGCLELIELNRLVATVGLAP